MTTTQERPDLRKTYCVKLRRETPEGTETRYVPIRANSTMDALIQAVELFGNGWRFEVAA